MQDKGTEILLSISIMVSGREDTTWDCINSLKHLRERVPCELILTDTGCSPQLHEQLEKEADQIIRFKWCNDFSAARNVGLNAAGGKWFLFMDDDEWFESTEGIERFFLSGEYEKYLSASYIVRNYMDMQGTTWRDQVTVRMVKKHERTKFIDPIHESLWPILEPIKHLNDYVHHYGYASEDPQKQLEKRERNLSLLVPAVEKDKHNMRLYLQTAMEYVALPDFEKALFYMEEGIHQCIPGDECNGNHVWGLFAGRVRLLLYLDRWQEVLETGEKTLKLKNITPLAQASVYADLLVANSHFENVEEGIVCLRQYLKWKHHFESNAEEFKNQQTLLLDAAFDAFHYRMSMWEGLYLYLLRGDAVTTERLIKRENTQWWCETIQSWYGKNSGERRDNWKRNFERMIRRVEETGEECPHLSELYRILTMPEQDGLAGEDVPDGSTMPERESSPGVQPTAEMMMLAAQLKAQIRVLLEQNQKAEALAAITQLRGLFPQDEELKQMEYEAANR